MGKTIATIVNDERLRSMLQSGQNGNQADVLMKRWWELARTEISIDEQIGELEERLIALQQRRERVLGGRETVEMLIVERNRPQDDAAPENGHPEERENQ